MRALATGWLAGTLWLQSQPQLPPSWFVFFLFFAGTSLLVGCLLMRSRWCVALVLGAGLLLGAGWSAWLAQQRMSDVLPAALEGRDLELTGVVAELPDAFDGGQRFVLEVEQAFDGDTPVTVPHRIALGWYADDTDLPVLQPGQRWRLPVRLKRPHGQSNPQGFDVEAWWLTERVRATGYVRDAAPQLLQEFVPGPEAVVGKARALLRERILRALPEARHAAVLVALVIGDQRGIATADRDLFNRSGIGHLVSISGLHITMIAALVAGLLHWLWRHSFFIGESLPLRLPARKAASLAGLLAALLYVALAGFGIPAQRTLLMLAVGTLAIWSGRLLPASRVLCCALLAVLVCDPWSVLWPGFWLSFGAIACILFAADGRFEGQDAGSWRQALAGAASTQFAVTAGLLPLTMLLFGQLSVVSPLANAIAIPVVSFIVTPLSLLGSVLPEPLCGWLLWLAHAAFSLLVSWLELLAGASFAVWQAPLPGLWEAAVAIAGTLWMLAPRGWPLRWVGVLAWLPLLVALPSAPAQGVWITAFDIGQGNAVLVETPNFRLLYDTGPAYSNVSDGGGRVILPYLRARGIDRIDGMVISHSDQDHAGGARTLMQSLTIGWMASSLPVGHPLVGDRHARCVAGQRWQWDGVEFEFRHPLSADTAEPKPNARSCVLKLSVGTQGLLLAGDIEAPQERALLARAGDRLRADVLLAPHHGSGTSSTPAFLGAVAPQWAVFQLGYRNRYRHPKAEVVARYNERGIRVLRSDSTGAVRVRMDGARIDLERACESPRYWSSQHCADISGWFENDR